MSEDNIFILDTETSGLFEHDYSETACIVAESDEYAGGADLSYREFIMGITQLVAEKAGREFKVSGNQILKNNSITLDSISILREGQNIAPNIYLNGYYSDYVNGISSDSIAEEIMSLYYRCMHGMEDDVIGDFSFEHMKNKIIYKLINYDLNRDLLESTPHLRYKDLAVIFCCLIKLDHRGMGSIRITNEHINKWGVGVEELRAQAEENSEYLMPHSFRNIFNVLAEIMLTEIEERGEESRNNEEFKDLIDCLICDDDTKLSNSMYVLTSKSGLNGAACMLYKGLLKSIYESLGCGYYILPSSVHEVLIVPDNIREDKGFFENMVSEVNREHVPAQDILSDGVYHYPEDSFELDGELL